MSKSPEQHITTYAGNIVIVKYAMPFQFRVVKHSLSVDTGSVTGSTVSVKGGIFIDENTIFISENTAYLSITHNPFITRADLISPPKQIYHEQYDNQFSIINKELSHKNL